VDSQNSVTALAGSLGERSAYVTPSQVLRCLYRRRYFLAGTLSLVIAASAAVLVALPNWYTASVLLAPEEQAALVPAQFAGLASLAGLSLGSTTEGPQFYAAILTSRPITDAVLNRRFPVGFEVVVDSARLLDLLEPKGATEAERLWNGTRLLAGRMAVTPDVRTGMIRLNVTLPSPISAAAVANQFVWELNRFNAEVRQSQARARREFIEARVTEVASELTKAEEEMRQFLVENRDYENSPRLTFEYGRLQRVMNTEQELYLDLQRQLNTARIEEVDDIPAVSTIEHAVPPQRKSRPRRALWLALITFSAGLALSAAVVLRDHGRTILGLDSANS
jgi:uncharacterized protein involved in exopolysaccharide biosynthesis